MLICKLTCLGNQERCQFENKWQYIISPQKARVCWKVIHTFSWWRICYAIDHWHKQARNHYPEDKNKNKSKLSFQLSIRRSCYWCNFWLKLLRHVPAGLSKVWVYLLEALWSLVKPVIKSKRSIKPCLRLSLQVGIPTKFVHGDMHRSTPCQFLYKEPVCKQDLYIAVMVFCTTLGSEIYELLHETGSWRWLG